MIISLLADTAPDPQISGNWLIAMAVAVIGAASTAAGHLRGRKKGLEEAASNITVKSPVPVVPVKREYTPPTFSQHMDLARRVDSLESGLAEVRRDQAAQFVKLLEVGERRKDDIFEKIDDVAKAWHSRLDSQFGPKPRGGKQA